MSNESLPPWDEFLSAAARLRKIVPDAVLVSEAAATFHTNHPRGQDNGHRVETLHNHFDEILQDLESVAGRTTARTRCSILIRGNLNGIPTGIRQLIRDEPLETTALAVPGSSGPMTLPTIGEVLRIKSALVLKRNATRDYLDIAALSHRIGLSEAVEALACLDRLYPQPNGASVTQQLVTQLANPRPFDLEDTDLTEYEGLDSRWHSFKMVRTVLADLALAVVEMHRSMRTQDTSDQNPSG